MEVVLAALFLPIIQLFLTLCVAALVVWVFQLIIDAIRGYL